MDLKTLFDGYTYPWLTITLAGIAGVLLALAAHAVLCAALRRLTRFSVVASTVVEYVTAPLRLVLPLLALNFVLAERPADLWFGATAEHALTILLIVAFTWLAMRAVTGVAAAVIRLHPVSVADNLHARRIETQTRVLSRTVAFFVLLVGAASVLMTFPGMRQIGTSLLASAGVAGIVAGVAARPVLGNLIAGLQIALTQPIRLDDVVIIENEWGRIEEITATYIIVKIWDERRLVVPLEWVISHPFQNWTRTGSELLGTVFLRVDYRVPLAPIRAELERVCNAAPEWDRRVAMIQVTEADARGIELRALVSAQDASKAWDLRCRVREALIDFLQREYPDSLPRVRAELDNVAKHPPTVVRAEPPLRAGKGDSSSIKHPTHANIAQDGVTAKGG